VQDHPFSVGKNGEAVVKVPAEISASPASVS